MPYIHLRTERVEYEFRFETKFLILSGDSGSGKSTLVDLVAQFDTENRVVQNYGDTNITTLTRIEQFSTSGDIIFLDENNKFLQHENVSNLFGKSNNYFVIVTRTRKITKFKLSLDSFVTIKMANNGRYHTIQPVYPKEDSLTELGECIISEDAKSGRKFLTQILGVKVETADGDSKFLAKMLELNKDSYTLVFDRAGMGYKLEKLLGDAEYHKIKLTSVIDWDSFESYILESPDYNIKVPDYPDKEQNALKLFKEVIYKNYNKRKLPNNMKFPVYWKVADAIEILKHQICENKCNDNSKEMKLF